MPPKKRQMIPLKDKMNVIPLKRQMNKANTFKRSGCTKDSDCCDGCTCYKRMGLCMNPPILPGP